jgi:hypothetical protein
MGDRPPLKSDRLSQWKAKMCLNFDARSGELFDPAAAPAFTESEVPKIASG